MQKKNYINNNDDFEGIIIDWEDYFIPIKNSLRTKRWKDMYSVNELTEVEYDVNQYGRERFTIYFEGENGKHGFSYTLEALSSDYMAIKEVVFSMLLYSKQYISTRLNKGKSPLDVIKSKRKETQDWMVFDREHE